MKNNWIKVLAAVAATVCLTTGVQATQVDGTITFTGGITLDTTSAGTATEVTSWTGTSGTGNPIVLTDSGDFATYVTPGDSVIYASPWSFNSGALANFWSVDGFTFDLISSVITSQSGTSPHGQVSVSGTGTISGNGFDPTVIVWNFSTQDPSSGHKQTGEPIFSFSAAAASIPSVPDGGTTMMLLGGALMGLGFIKRKLSA
jgi:VPDSG-CTERM motif